MARNARGIMGRVGALAMMMLLAGSGIGYSDDIPPDACIGGGGDAHIPASGAGLPVRIDGIDGESGERMTRRLFDALADTLTEIDAPMRLDIVGCSGDGDPPEDMFDTVTIRGWIEAEDRFALSIFAGDGEYFAGFDTELMFRARFLDDIAPALIAHAATRAASASRDAPYALPVLRESEALLDPADRGFARRSCARRAQHDVGFPRRGAGGDRCAVG